MIENQRVADGIERLGERFLNRFFTAGEREDCDHRPEARSFNWACRREDECADRECSGKDVTADRDEGALELGDNRDNDHGERSVLGAAAERAHQEKDRRE